METNSTDILATADMLVAELKAQSEHIAADETGAADRVRPYMPAVNEHLRQALHLLEEGAA